MATVSHDLLFFSFSVLLLSSNKPEVLSLSTLTKELQGKKLEGQEIISNHIILIIYLSGLLFLNFFLCWQLLEGKVPPPFEE